VSGNGDQHWIEYKKISGSIAAADQSLDWVRD
jgi:hypothetical protein